MKLHENKQLYNDAIRFAAQQMNLPPEFVEKDYWVTFALFLIFNSEIGNDTVFKGGTALSKCYNMIERFSEDIDLVVVRRSGDSNSKLTKKIRTISDVVGAFLPEVNMEGVTRKMGMSRKTVHTYNKDFIGSYGQVRDVIVVEATWLGYSEPHSTKKINSFVGQMMLNNNQLEMVKENNLLPFDVLALEPIRTICEKIMSLIRFSHGDNPLDDLKKKIRHIYDLHYMLKREEYAAFFYSTDFDELLIKVANDDVASFKNNNKWLIHHPNEARIFKDVKHTWNELKTTYNNDFKNLVYGDFPNDVDILETLELIQERLKGISWAIKV